MENVFPQLNGTNELLKQMKKILYILLIAAIFGCESTINPELETPAEIMVVDGWINNKMERQEIKITRSQPYFDNSRPAKISGATVTVEDMNTGVIYEFKEGQDSYFWEPSDAPFGEAGNRYKLRVGTEGETFEAFSTMGRVPAVDSVLFNFNSKNFGIPEDFYTAEFLAIDPAGTGDTYWIKAWKNGNFLGKPEELNIAYDAGFSAGQPVDGMLFIAPIRGNFVNPLDENPEKENEILPPYQVGDSLYVEIHSLDPLAFEFLFVVARQINRPGGFAELFALPLANAPTNIKSISENSDTEVAGFFNVAAVSSGGETLTQELADLARQQKQ